jgi:hypothetical protein
MENSLRSTQLLIAFAVDRCAVFYPQSGINTRDLLRRKLRLSGKSGSYFDAVEEDLNEVRDAVKLMSDLDVASKATGILNEMLNVIKRIEQSQSYKSDEELNSAAQPLFLAVLLLRSYFNEKHYIAPSELSEMYGGEVGGLTIEDDTDAMIGKVTQYLTTLCPT